MPQIAANGIHLAYEISGPADGAPLLMIHGLGAQLTRWPKGLCDQLEAAGFRLIRFDNRDVGLSTHLHGVAVPDVAAAVAARRRGEEPAVPYAIADLADDTAALLQALGISEAHVLGVSLGGQVAQSLASRYSGVVRSLTLMMTRSGNPDLPPPRSDVLGSMTEPAADPFEEEARFLDQAAATSRTLGSPAYPTDVKELKAAALAAAHRAFDPQGVGRQLAAGRTVPDNREELGRLTMPVLVIHGAEDMLLPFAGGEDIANRVPQAWFLKIHGMGHDLPAPLFDIFVSAIAANSRRPKAVPVR
jgi:pimeloyl-ACP methyl ester carboxylesterase